MLGVLFIILLTCAGMWNITDGWFSLSLYLRDKNQTWHRDHYIRVIRIGIGVMLLYMAWTFGRVVFGV